MDRRDIWLGSVVSSVKASPPAAMGRHRPAKQNQSSPTFVNFHFAFGDFVWIGSTGRIKGRCAGIYTSSYVAGSAGSFLIAGVVDAAFGWRATYIVAGMGPLLSICTCISANIANRVRSRLFAGGRWIRTFGGAEEPFLGKQPGSAPVPPGCNQRRRYGSIYKGSIVPQAACRSEDNRQGRPRR
jgi:hypothetical protein